MGFPNHRGAIVVLAQPIDLKGSRQLAFDSFPFCVDSHVDSASYVFRLAPHNLGRPIPLGSGTGLMAQRARYTIPAIQCTVAKVLGLLKGTGEKQVKNKAVRSKVACKGPTRVILPHE